jgi:hypothetical protein
MQRMSKHHQPRVRALVAGLSVAVLALTLTACGEESSSSTAASSGETDSPYEPTESPTMAVEMTDAPASYSEIEGDGFSISAPGEFQQQRETSSNGEPMLILEKPSLVDGVPQRVAVIRDVAPVSTAVEQSFALESAKSAAGPEAEVSRLALTAPEGQAAYLTTWVEAQGAGGKGQVDVTYWQLMYQVSDELILNVVAFAPTEEFETSEVSTILRTFVPEGASA